MPDTGRLGVLAEAAGVAVVLGLAATLRLELLGTRSLWYDEGFSLHLARRALPEILAALRSGEPHPVGYYALLSAWLRVVGDDLAAVRALSAVFGLGAVLLTWLAGRALFSPLTGVLGALLVAVNPFQIVASNELRMYAPLSALALLSTWLLWRASQGAGWAVWIAYGGCVAAMAYTSYYSFLLLPAHALWVVFRARAHLRGAVLSAAVAVVTYLPWVFFVLGSPRVPPFPWRVGLWPTYLLEVAGSHTFGGYLFGLMTYVSRNTGPAAAYVPLLFPFALLAGIGARHLARAHRPARDLVAVAWLIPVILVVVASAAWGKVVAYPRHLLFLQPFAALLVAGGIVGVRDVATDRCRPAASLLALTVVLVPLVAAVGNLQGNPAYQIFRYDQAARLVARLYAPGDVVVYFPGGVEHPFRHYFDPPGPEVVVPVWADRWSRQALAPSVEGMKDLIGPRFRRVWLVFSVPFPDGAVVDLAAAIESLGFRRVYVEDFGRVWVAVFARPGASR
ncbi:MAG: glycosyltransferase family 39 protein [Armatimonadota bacterium]|nr:glycosyltransferase family 39 protein [Armatimonadota bacterium]